jgi:hypothetical protein
MIQLFFYHFRFFRLLLGYSVFTHIGYPVLGNAIMQHSRPFVSILTLSMVGWWLGCCVMDL